jgi:hypothetical protein
MMTAFPEVAAHLASMSYSAVEIRSGLDLAEELEAATSDEALIDAHEPHPAWRGGRARGRQVRRRARLRGLGVLQATSAPPSRRSESFYKRLILAMFHHVAGRATAVFRSRLPPSFFIV